MFGAASEPVNPPAGPRAGPPPSRAARRTRTRKWRRPPGAPRRARRWPGPGRDAERLRTQEPRDQGRRGKASRSPAAASRAPSRSTSAVTCPGRAPSAMRTPNSRRRGHRVRDDAVDPDRREHQRDRGERRGDNRREALRGARADDVLAERADVVRRELRIERGDHLPHRAGQRRGIAARPHQVRHRVALNLPLGEVDLVAEILEQAAVPQMADDANHRRPVPRRDRSNRGSDAIRFPIALPPGHARRAS